eukprot:TRINITY_DN1437_c0_g1_i6.p1 TRINITY_DN1437_c0_g1~~TRINITY_DN1437_c0_g1_i6.p1  ORF type:complete len:340 (-),score=92.49 TRINITY_DN1437_c0_g1_i6:117-1136(-)
MEEINLFIDTNRMESQSIKIENNLNFDNEEENSSKTPPNNHPSYSTNHEIKEQINKIRNKLNLMKEKQNNNQILTIKPEINSEGKRIINQLPNENNFSNNPHPIKQNINNFYYHNKNIPATSSTTYFNISSNKKKKITYIEKIETIKTIETQMEDVDEENDDTDDQDDQIEKKIEEIRYKKQMIKQKIEEMKNQRKEILPEIFGNIIEEGRILMPNVPSIFLPKLGIKSGTMYCTISFEKNMPDNYYNPRNSTLEDVSENLAMTMGFAPPQIKGLKLGFLTPNYSQEEMEKYSKGLLSVCTKDVNYIRILSFRKTANGNVIAFDQVSVMYNYNGKPHKA